jgi:hypothetical protein
VQSDARSPVQDVQEPVSTEATDEKSTEEHGVNTYTAPALDPPALSSKYAPISATSPLSATETPK